MRTIKYDKVATFKIEKEVWKAFTDKHGRSTGKKLRTYIIEDLEGK